MACIIAHGKAFDKFVSDNNLDKGTAVYVIIKYQSATKDYIGWPDSNFIQNTIGSEATFTTDRQDLVDLWNRDYSNPYRAKRFSNPGEWESSDEVQNAVKIFGRENVIAYTTDDNQVLFVKKPILKNQETQPEANNQAAQKTSNIRISVLDGINTDGISVVPDRKGMAGYNPRTGKIELKKGRFVPIEVIDHLYGRNGQPYYDQKAEVMKRLASEGWTEDAVRNLITNSEDATSLVVLHEQSHKDNADKYDVKTYMSEEALNIETRATRDALIRLRELKNDTGEILEDKKDVITWAGDDVFISDYVTDDGVSEALIHPRKESEQGITVRRNTDGPWVIIQNTGDMGSRHIRKTAHRVADIIPLGQEVSTMSLGDNTTLVSLLKKDGFVETESGTLVKKAITTADLHITPVADGGYRTRTVYNARTTDATIALAEAFNTAGERLTEKSAGPNKYANTRLVGNTNDVNDIVNILYGRLVRNNGGKAPKGILLNVAGGSIVNLSQDQGYYNSLVTDVIKGLLEKGITIREIRSGGQTGIDEAGIKAAQALNIQWSVVGTSHWTYRVPAQNKKGYNDINDKGAFIERFNGERKPVKYNVPQTGIQSKPDVISLNARSYSGLNFRTEYGIKLSKEGASSKDVKENILQKLQTEEISIGSKITPDATDVNNLGTVLEALNKISINYLKPAAGQKISRNGFTEEQITTLHGLKKYGVVVTNKSVIVPTYTVGYSEDKLQLMQFEENLTGSHFFKSTELRAWAKSAIFRVSDIITQLQSNPEYAAKLFASPEYQRYANLDYADMSRIDIINPETGPGLKTLLSLVKESIFNPVNRPDVSGLVRDKLSAVYNNFSAFIRYAYDSLSSLEGVSLNSDFIDEENASILDTDEHVLVMDAQTEEELIEVHGSSAEAWQTGFRQISAVLSLSRAIKLELGKLSKLDNTGKPIINEDLNTRETISVGDAATKILAWVQGATTLEEMVSKLQNHMESEPWLRQLVGEYYSGETGEGPLTQGLLLNPKSNAFASEFFSNFKKYFQNYCITYADKEGTKIKMINNSSFADGTLNTIRNLAANMSNGNYTIWDAQKRQLSSEFYRLKNDVIGFEDPGFGIQARPGSMYDMLKEMDTEDSTPDKILNKIAEAYRILQIPVPTISELRVVFPTIDSIVKDNNGFFKSIQFLLSGLENNYDEREGIFDPFSEQSVARNYKNLLNAIAPVMQNGLEAVTYQGGKLHYSYVTPSYLNLFIDKLKGNVKNYDEFMNEEFLKHVGWFYINENAPKGLVTGIEFYRPGDEFTGHLNYWVEQLMTAPDKDAIRANLQHFVSLTDRKVKYEDKSDAQFTSSVISNYLALGNVYALFNVPTMSNKKSEEYIKFKKITDDFEDFITHQLVTKTFVQEVNRIRTVRDRMRNPNNRSIESFDDKRHNGTKFMFLDYLNKYLDPKNNSDFATLLRKYVYGESWKEGEKDRFVTLLPKVIQEEVNARFEKYVQALNDSAFLKYDKDNKSISDVFQLKDKLSYDKLKEFFWNDMFASINILQLTITDLALYPDAGQVQKRLAELHSPGMRGNVDALDIKTGKPVSDRKFRSAKLRDEVLPGEIASNLLALHTKILSDKKYRDENGKLTADAMILSRRFESLRKIINEINTADGQGYSSVSSYRKKMHIFGKWSQKWEDAYRAVLAGDFSKDNLDVLWQPLKPFVYGQTYKVNTSPNAGNYMPFIKVGIQNKNSEYALILADVLMRAGGMNNKLTAIFDVMEESYGLRYNEATKSWEGDPNDHGIDTFQFESAVKTGKTGVIDINSKKSYNEIKAEIENQIYADKEHTRYDEITIDVLPFADYAIQQDNPSHLTGSQKMGSQARVMAVSDLAEFDDAGNATTVEVPIGDGHSTKKMSTKEAKERYFNLLAENINQSADRLVKELGLIPADSNDGITSVKFRNIALSELLQKEILRDGRYGRDLLWACSTDVNGNFNLPLSDPIHAGRIQMLLNSIIKKRLWNQEIAGGPAIMVSSYGFDDENKLSVVYKDGNGNILQKKSEYKPEEHNGESYDEYLLKNQAALAYLECFVSVWDEQLITDFGKKDSTGKFTGEIDVKKIEAVNPKILELLSYRIPTEAKYSMVPMKVVGFMPRRGGEVLVLPKEITGIAGLDFDVDKNYIMRYEYSRRERKSVRKFMQEFKNQNLTPEVLASKEELERVKEMTRAVRSYLYGNDAALQDSALKDIIDQQWADFKETDVLYSTDVSGYDSERKNRNNEILALQWAFLTSPSAFREISSPGNFDEIKRVGYKLSSLEGKTAEEIKDEETKAASNAGGEIDYYKNTFEKPDNIIYADTKMVFHRRNMVAAKLIGVFAQGNVSHSIIGLHRDANGKQDVKIFVPAKNAFSFKVGDHIIKFNGNIPIDNEYDVTGAIKSSETIASFVGASADAVKDPVLNLLNVNMITVNSLLALLRCGVDLETIGWFLTSPVIRQVVLTHQQNEAAGRKSLRGTITRMKEQCKTVNGQVQFDTNFAFGQEFFKNHNAVKQNEIFTSENVQDTYNVLTLFERTLDLADAFQYITHMTRFNSVNSAPGPYAIHTMLNMQKVNTFYNHPYITGAEVMPGKNISAIMDAVDNPMLLAFRKNSIGIGRLGIPTQGIHQMLIQPNFIQAGSFMQNVMTRATERFGYMSKEELMRLSDFVLSYYMNIAQDGQNPLFDLSFKNRKKMIIDYASSIYPARAQAYREANGDNPLLDHIRQEFNQNNGEYSLKLNTRGMLPESLEDLKAGWNDIFNDEEERISRLSEEGVDVSGMTNFGMELLEYNFFRHGLGFSPKTWIQEAPAEMRAVIPGYIEALNSEKPVDYSIHVDRCIDQYILNTNNVDKGVIESTDFYGISVDERYPVGADNKPRRYTATYKRNTGKNFQGLSGYTYMAVENNGPVVLVYVNINPSKYTEITVVDKLGGADNDFFEIDPQEEANNIRTVIKYDQSSEDGLGDPDGYENPEDGPSTGMSSTEGDSIGSDTDQESLQFESKAIDKMLDNLGVNKGSNIIETLHNIVDFIFSNGLEDIVDDKTLNTISQFRDWLDMIDKGTLTPAGLVKNLQEKNVCGI